MAEEGVQLISNRRLVFVIGGLLLVVLFFFLWSFRGCIPNSISKDKGYVTIYTNLDLKDTANVVTRLKDLKIQYEIKNNGTAIAVPKDRSDEAKLGLAEKNLPLGGSVGWEIFNETKMGATDFDRRIQLIRAISGELSRTIKRIEGVEDARVQIVLPESKLFEVTKAPVTAAVLLKISLGKRLRPEQVNGIVHLVSNSVENLKPENVTLVDDFGNILTAKAFYKQEEIGTAETSEQPVIIKKTEEIPMAQQVFKKEEVQQENKEKPTLHPTVITGETKNLQYPQKTFREQEKILGQETKMKSIRFLSEEERVLLKLKAKEEYEQQLTAKAQELLNQFYPQNSIIVRVNIIFGSVKKGIKSSKLKIKSGSNFIFAPIQKITVVALIDKNLKLTPKLKKSTYKSIAAAISYSKKRGDRIILKQVPFHYAEVLPEKFKHNSQTNFLDFPYFLWGSGVLVGFLLFLIIRRRRQSKMIFEDKDISKMNINPPTENEAMETVKAIKNLANTNPEKIANLIKKWLSE